MYSLSRRCIRNGTQANPLSIQRVFSFGKRSGIPFSTQFVMWIMLQKLNPSACTEMNLFNCASDESAQ